MRDFYKIIYVATRVFYKNDKNLKKIENVIIKDTYIYKYANVYFIEQTLVNRGVWSNLC